MTKAVLLVASIIVLVSIYFGGSNVLKKFGHQYYVKNRLIGPFANESQDFGWLNDDPAWQVDKFSVNSSVELVGVVREPKEPNENTPWILYFHGNGGIKYSNFREAYRELAGDNDWGFAAWTYRGYGMSEGVSTISSIRSDAVLQSERLFEKWNVTPSQLRVFGVSLGTAPAGYVGYWLSARELAPGASVFMATGYRPRWPYRAIYDNGVEPGLRAKISSPMLITHGSFDTAHRLNAALDDYKPLKNLDAQLIVVPAGHYHMQYPGIQESIRLFFENPQRKVNK